MKFLCRDTFKETVPLYKTPKRPVMFETERLEIREIKRSDFSFLREILEDSETMRFYAGAFTYWEVRAWLKRQLRRYKKQGFGLWAVTLKQTGIMIGQCGVTLQHYKTQIVPEIGYLFNKNYWHKGYATEAAIACKRYAFNILGFNEVFSFIHINNRASQRVAERNGMWKRDRFTIEYKKTPMLLYLYTARKP